MGVDELVALPGTVRARTPEQTWAAVAGRLPDYGITRVADLTGLDCIGLPVWTAVRPASATLSTSQGKGATDLLAKLSSVMEAIELWHVEQPLPIAACGPSAEVAPDCPVAALPLTATYSERTLARMVWDWTPGTSLVSGEQVLLPADLVRRRAQRPIWSPDLLRATSTGLACGNTGDEALLHALYEVVERDVLYQDGQSGGRRRTLVDPGTVDDPHGREVIARLEAAGMALEVALVDGPYELPVCVAYLWSEDYPVIFAGGGCHNDPAIALTRALTEAAQSRLTAIAGTRDDLPSDPSNFDTSPFHPPRTAGLAPWPEVTAHFTPAVGGFSNQVRATAQMVEGVTGYEPVALDLSVPTSPVHAVQVVCPGTRSRIRRSMPR
ncbi:MULTISPECIES: YcaO-like family protein [unclassified Streptomyces]|uniref:YcaO-like family protein n=1 Tax=unclassified Streptomyces TaxID=2593676 RepID=UPI00225A0D9F|nr:MULTISPECIES: YcaO-like family protein [unclassified Streptomyces]MCX4554317.1 YcaO-like family protein [Streptomyces sp. NBC_01500]WSC25025.1 YcaO-like family protein [Streptomyces sp. NBC_01766]